MYNVYKFLNTELKLLNGDVIVIGCSGGPDSMCLLNILLDIRKTKDIKLICAHVNHNVRSESVSEEEFIRKYCDDKRILFESMTIEKYGDDNFHSEARSIRYSFFEELVKKYDAKYLMTAHHGDDLIETVLMRITRGSTIRGYSGFSKLVDKNNYKIARPLIFITKEEILKYNKENNIPYATDLSNFKGKYTRNRFRSVVLPFLKAEDKNINKKFLKFSEELEEYDTFINNEIKRIIDRVYINKKININEFLTLDTIIQRKIIHYVLEEAYQDDLLSINDAHVNLIMKLIKSKRASASLNLPHGKSMVKSYNNIMICEISVISNYEIELIKYVNLPNGKMISYVPTEESNDNYVCRLLKEEIVFPLYVRTRRLGDKMLLKKIDGYRKIKDIFIDAKIPLIERDSWPIVVDSNDRIIWIPGVKKSKFTKQKNDKYDIILKYD